MFGGFIFGFIIGFIIGVLFGRYAWATTVANSLGAIVGLIWAVFVMRMALTKRYKDFRIAIVGL
jgi:multisubunit Na+/H+ antiporter MnhE subunit